jgi:HK97 family phage major capsid protein
LSVRLALRQHVKGTRMKSHELRQKAAELREKILATINTAEKENREVTADESGIVDAWKAEAESLDRRAKTVEDAENAVAESRKSAGRITAPLAANDDDGVSFESIEPGKTEADKRRSFGEFLSDIVAVTDRNTSRDDYERAQDRISNLYRSRYRDYSQAKNKETRVLSSTTGVSGGYLMPTDFMAEVNRYKGEQGIVRPRARVIPMNGLEIEVPQLDAATVPTGGSAHYGGVKMDWTAELNDKPETEPTFKQARLIAHELAGYCAVSRTTLLKSPISIDSLLFQLFGESAAREEDRAFFRGNTSGRPFGVHFHPSLVATAARGSASAITFANATAVWTRVPPAYRGNAVWVVSQAAESAVLTMTGVANGVFYPSGVYTNSTDTPNAGAGSAGVMLYMRPVLVSSMLPALNTLGDFGCYDFTQYLIGDPGIMEVATSEHALFRKNQIAFRLINYVGGMPWPNTALTLDDGSTTVSPFVALQIQ